MSLYLQTTGVGGFLTLYRYKLRFRGSHSEVGCWDVSPSQSRPEPTAMKTKTPWKHHYFQCVSATCFRANAYGALGYLHDYSVLTLWGEALLIPFYRAGNSVSQRQNNLPRSPSWSVPEPGKWKKSQAGVYCFRLESCIYNLPLLLSSPHRDTVTEERPFATHNIRDEVCKTRMSLL